MSAQTIAQAAGLSTPDLAEAARFLSILDPNATFFTFQTFDDSKPRRPTLAKIRHGNLAARISALCDANKAGAGIFVTVNQTDRKGREAGNIVRARAVWFEFDNKPNEPGFKPLPENWPLDPSMIVESSPGNKHLYWLLADGETMTPEQHRDVINHMVNLGSDPIAKGINRVLRVPGFYHMKDPTNPHRVKILEVSGKLYTVDEIMDAFPPVEKAPVKPVQTDASDFLNHKPDHLQGVPVEDIGTGLPPGPWDIYNAANPLTDTMERYGYTHVGGERWHSPLQKRKSNHVYAFDNGTWTSHSGSDAAAGIGRESDKGHRWGTAYDIYVYFEHANNHKAADAAIRAGAEPAFERTEPNAPGDDDDAEPNAPIEGELAARITKVFSSRPFDADNHTDLANARRIKRAYGHALCYCPAVNWLVHKHTWHPDKQRGEQVFHTLGRLIRDEATQMDQWVASAPAGDELAMREKARSGRMAWAMISEGCSKISAAIKLGEREMVIAADRLDRNPLHIGLTNGVYDLGTDTFHDELPAAYVTHEGGVAYEPGATCHRWDGFVLEIMGGDVEMAAYLHRLMGYVLTADRSEHLLLILQGSGANGKSTFVGIIQKLLGSYAMSLPGDVLSRAGGLTENQRADLRGKRLCVLAETRDGGRLNESQAKELTGNDPIYGRALYKAGFTFIPTHQLLIQTNHRPVIRGDDHGIWRRIELIPFDVRFDDRVKDPELGKKLEAELPGVLNWMIEGYRQYKAKGLCRPDTIKKAKAAYRNEEDIFAAWFEETCDTSKSTAATALTSLYGNFKSWAEDEGLRVTMTRKHFRQRLADVGFPVVSGGGRVVSVAGISIFGRF